MNNKIVRHLISAVVLLVTFLGCGTMIGPTGDTLLIVDSTFSDAPVSPGGTGGTTGADLSGTEDVELPAEETRSFFTAFQIDPVSEDTAGPKFVISADIDQDGLLDLVSAWNQSQPVQLHLQRRDDDDNITFRTITLGGTTPIAIVAGIEVGQIDGDGWLDIVVLVKATAFGAFCPTIPPSEVSKLEGEIMVFFSPGAADQIPDGDRWTTMTLVNAFVQDRWIHNHFPGKEEKTVDESKTAPEWSGFTALVVADFDGQPGDDIVVALNPASCKELGQDPPLNTVDLWVNPGPALVTNPAAWGAAPPTGLSGGVPVAIMSDAPQVKDLAAVDIDGDGDLDIVGTWTNSLSQNIVWARNPLIAHEPGGPDGAAAVVAGTVPGTDICVGGVNDDGVCFNGDIDCLGVPDGTCAGGACVGGASPGAACTDSTACTGIPDGTCLFGRWRHFATEWQLRPVGQVDTHADILAIGDMDLDGFDDIIVRSTDGQIVQWFRRPNPLVVEPEFPPNDPMPDRFNFPWPVFTLTEFTSQEPVAIAIGDLTGDDRVEVVISVEGGIFWYDGTVGDSVFDPWFPTTIVQDSVGVVAEQDTPGAGLGVDEVGLTTHINTLLIVDLDGDDRNDIIATLDRRANSGLSDDRLVWYRNVRTVETPE